MPQRWSSGPTRGWLYKQGAEGRGVGILLYCCTLLYRFEPNTLNIACCTGVLYDTKCPLHVCALLYAAVPAVLLYCCTMRAACAVPCDRFVSPTFMGVKHAEVPNTCGCTCFWVSWPKGNSKALLLTEPKMNICLPCGRYK